MTKKCAQRTKREQRASRAADTPDYLLRSIEATAKAWKAKNRAAIRAANAYVDKHGLPLARYRLF